IHDVFDLLLRLHVVGGLLVRVREVIAAADALGSYDARRGTLRGLSRLRGARHSAPGLALRRHFRPLELRGMERCLGRGQTRWRTSQSGGVLLGSGVTSRPTAVWRLRK